MYILLLEQINAYYTQYGFTFLKILKNTRHLPYVYIYRSPFILVTDHCIVDTSCYI